MEENEVEEGKWEEEEKEDEEQDKKEHERRARERSKAQAYAVHLYGRNPTELPAVMMRAPTHSIVVCCVGRCIGAGSIDPETQSRRASGTRGEKENEGGRSELP